MAVAPGVINAASNLTAAADWVRSNADPSKTAGPTFNAETSWNGEDWDNGRGVADHVIRSDDTIVRLYPGLLLGLQI